MVSRCIVTVVCVSLLGVAGQAEGKIAKPKKPSGTTIDGVWHAKGTVIVAKHISDASVGQKFTRKWTIKSACSGACKTTHELPDLVRPPDQRPASRQGQELEGLGQQAGLPVH